MNGFWRAAYRAGFAHRRRAFARALRSPEAVQTAVLSRILREMQNTEYGRAYGISSKMKGDEFRRRVPIVNYEELAPWVERQTLSRAPVLTPGRLVTFEPTSGSRGARKLIPYNRAQLRTFERMFVLWSIDVLRADRRLGRGKVFFLISPKPSRPTTLPNGIPTGLDSDADYLGGFLKRFTERFFVAAPELAQSQNYVRDLADRFLREPELEIISVWSPSLLVLALENLILRGHALARVFPRLKLISCWDSAQSAGDARILREKLPGVWVQGKGLLATEAAMTLPWCEGGGFLPLLQDTYFEFEDELNGEVRGLHQIREGGIYRILTTTANGFMRYRLGDRVRVGPPVHATPRLEFLGRAGEVMDLIGEKLNSVFVEETLEALDMGFALVVPAVGAAHGYRLLVEREADRARAAEVEKRFSTQHHYALARRLGQLAPLDAVHVATLRERYFRLHRERQIGYGQIKRRVLIGDGDLAESLAAPT